MGTQKKMPFDDKDCAEQESVPGGRNLLGLLFEDLFKIFNKDLKRSGRYGLVCRIERKRSTWSRRSGPDTISNGMINAIATGNGLAISHGPCWCDAGVIAAFRTSPVGDDDSYGSQSEKTRKSVARSRCKQVSACCPADTPRVKLRLVELGTAGAYYDGRG
jgi:hypothetical protein